MTPSQRIDEDAAEWAVRLHAGALPAEDQRALDEWLAADSRHPGALLQAQVVWLDLDRLGALAAGKPIQDATMRAQAPASAPATADAPLPAHGIAPATSRPPRKAALALAAAIATLAIGATFWWTHVNKPSVYVSDVGEVRRVRLADGSNMVLNTASRVTVRMDESQRDIRLETGEGLFEVARDPARPFVVHAGSISIRALGTVFSVRAIDQQVDVTVTEGLVELIDHSQGKSAAPRRIAANERAMVTEVRQVEVLPAAPEQTDRRLAWREGMLAFDGETLLYAVTEMNRHNHRRIVIDDPALATRPVVGLFRASDPDNFAATVAIALGVESVSTDDAIHLR